MAEELGKTECSYCCVSVGGHWHWHLPWRARLGARACFWRHFKERRNTPDAGSRAVQHSASFVLHLVRTQIGFDAFCELFSDHDPHQCKPAEAFPQDFICLSYSVGSLPTQSASSHLAMGTRIASQSRATRIRHKRGRLGASMRLAYPANHILSAPSWEKSYSVHGKWQHYHRNEANEQA